ncbi:hypothetical protein Anapl_06835, partial [Anas platyrhynchos]
QISQARPSTATTHSKRTAAFLQRAFSLQLLVLQTALEIS